MFNMRIRKKDLTVLRLGIKDSYRIIKKKLWFILKKDIHSFFLWYTIC